MEPNRGCKLWVYADQMPSSIRNFLPPHVKWLGKAEVAEVISDTDMDVTIMQGTTGFLEGVLSLFGQDASGSRLQVILPADRL